MHVFLTERSKLGSEIELGGVVWAGRPARVGGVEIRGKKGRGWVHQ